MSNRYAYTLIIIVFLLSGCRNSEYPGFSLTDSGIHYRLHEIGDGERSPMPGEYVTGHVIAGTLSDTTYTADSIFVVSFTDGKKDDFRECLSMLVAGDSATFIIPPGDQGHPESQGNTPAPVIIHVKVLKIQNREQYDEEQRYLAWKRDEEMNEQIRLTNFLGQHQVGMEYFLDGIYFMETRKGKGSKVQSGDYIRLHYRGYFLDSTQFDSTYESGEPLEFTVGDPDQVIRGIEIGIRQMRSGGKAKFIIPSHLAFGEQGSSTGIVPPFTTLIYEIELKKVL